MCIRDSLIGDIQSGFAQRSYGQLDAGAGQAAQEKHFLAQFLSGKVGLCGGFQPYQSAQWRVPLPAGNNFAGDVQRKQRLAHSVQAGFIFKVK